MQPTGSAAGAETKREQALLIPTKLFRNADYAVSMGTAIPGLDFNAQVPAP